MTDQLRFCELCGRRLELYSSPSYIWWRCPRWPDRGEHWWSPPLTDAHHSMIRIPDNVDLTPKVFDRYTGKRVTT